jgi:hypothetical protein
MSRRGEGGMGQGGTRILVDVGSEASSKGASACRTEARGKWERASIAVRLVLGADEPREEGLDDLRSHPANAPGRSSM